MTARIEREFKLRIPSEAALQALLARLAGQVSPPVLQINHFFDTAERDLQRARIALRLREEAGRFVLALKGPRAEEDPVLAARPEEELAIEPDLARTLLAGEGSPLAVLGASALASRVLVREALARTGARPLRRIGAFENERTRVGPVVFPPGSGGPPLVFELDRTRFPDGRVDRELELELPEGVRATEVGQALRALFASLEIAAEPMPSKAARFFRDAGTVD